VTISIQQGRVDPKYQVEGVAPHQPFFFSDNYAKPSSVLYKNLDTKCFCFVTNHAFDRQTNKRTDSRMDGQMDRQNSHR